MCDCACIRCTHIQTLCSSSSISHLCISTTLCSLCMLHTYVSLYSPSLHMYTMKLYNCMVTLCVCKGDHWTKCVSEQRVYYIMCKLTSLSRLVLGRGWLLMVSLRSELLVACLSHTLWKAFRAAADMCHGCRRINTTYTTYKLTDTYVTESISCVLLPKLLQYSQN